MYQYASETLGYTKVASRRLDSGESYFEVMYWTEMTRGHINMVP